MIRLGYEHNIFLFCLPPKTTHKLQPLDVGIFSPLARNWFAHCDLRVAQGNPICRTTVIREYMIVCAKSMLPETVLIAFRKSGLNPLDRTVFTEDDFAPSKASSTLAHVPHGYPADIPTSPIMAKSSDVETTTDGDFSPSVDVTESSGDTSAEGDRFVRNFADLEVPSEDNVEDEGNNEGMDGEGAGMDIEVPTISTTTGGMVETQAIDHWRTTVLPGESSNSTRPSTPSSLPATSSRYWTRSTSQTSSAALSEEARSVKSALDLMESKKALAPRLLALPKQDLVNIILNQSDDNFSLSANLSASNAHCTLEKRENSDLRERLENSAKKRRTHHLRTTANFLTSPEGKELWHVQNAERLDKEREKKEKKEKKAATLAEKEQERVAEAPTKVFQAGLSSYKRKDELLMIAAALGITATGTNAQLASALKDHLVANPHLKDDPRFTALYIGKRVPRVPQSDVPGPSTSVATQVVDPALL